MSPEFASFFTTHQPLLQNCQRPPRVIPASCSMEKRAGEEKFYPDSPGSGGGNIPCACAVAREGPCMWIEAFLS